jgi:hypothetical protein
VPFGYYEREVSKRIPRPARQWLGKENLLWKPEAWFAAIAVERLREERGRQSGCADLSFAVGRIAGDLAINPALDGSPVGRALQRAGREARRRGNVLDVRELR